MIAAGAMAAPLELPKTLGVTDWSPVHDSSQFRLGGKLVTGLLNKGMFWRHEELGIAVAPGVDEIALTLSHRDEIEAFRQGDRERRPWAYPA